MHLRGAAVLQATVHPSAGVRDLPLRDPDLLRELLLRQPDEVLVRHLPLGSDHHRFVDDRGERDDMPRAQDGGAGGGRGRPWPGGWLQVTRAINFVVLISARFRLDLGPVYVQFCVKTRSISGGF